MPPVTTSTSAKEFPETTTSAGIYCQPTLVHQDSVVSEDNNQAPRHHHNDKNGEEESDGTSASAMTDEELQGLELWDEPFFSSYTSNRSEELAADLFGLLVPDQQQSGPASSPALNIEGWNGGEQARQEEITTNHGDRVVPVSYVPSCSDYSTTLYYNHAAESQDASHSSSGAGRSGFSLDYYNHAYPQAREAV